MRILLIADTHGMHEGLKIPDNIDMIAHGGDISNTKDVYTNEAECRKFLDWFRKIDVGYKCLIAGNHDTSIEKGLVDIYNDYPEITFLNHSSWEIEDATTGKKIVIFGSPYTPSFGDGWAYNVPRHKLETYWTAIPGGTNLLITHGPPQGIMDLSWGPLRGELEMCGDKSLMNRVREIQPQCHVFGHIHNGKGIVNCGVRILPDLKTRFVNASCVTDGKFDAGLTSHGTVISL